MSSGHPITQRCVFKDIVLSVVFIINCPQDIATFSAVPPGHVSCQYKSSMQHCSQDIYSLYDIQSSAVITRSNIVRYCINNCKNCGRISIRCWMHKIHPIPGPNGWAMWCLLWIFVIKVTALQRHRIVVSLWQVRTCSIWQLTVSLLICLCPFVPFYLHGLTLIPTWISNHIPSKVWDEITYPFPNFNDSTVEVWERTS